MISRYCAKKQIGSVRATSMKRMKKTRQQIGWCCRCLCPGCGCRLMEQIHLSPTSQHHSPTLAATVKSLLFLRLFNDDRVPLIVLSRKSRSSTDLSRTPSQTVVVTYILRANARRTTDGLTYHVDMGSEMPQSGATLMAPPR